MNFPLKSLILISLLISSLCFAETDRAFIKEKIEAFQKRNKIPGLAIAVKLGEEEVYRGLFGYSNAEMKTPVTEETVFELGQLSTTISAFGSMVLLDRRQFQINDPIGMHLPFLPYEWQHIPIRSILSHMSGIPHLEATSDWESFLTFARSRSQGTIVSPDQRKNFNFLNYYIIGKLIEERNGQNFLSFMKQQVWSRAGMNSTGSWSSLEDRAFRLRATGYAGNPNTIEIAEESNLLDFQIPAMGLVSSLSDLLAFDDAIFHGAKSQITFDTKKTLFQTVKPTIPSEYSFDFSPGWEVHQPSQNVKVYRMAGETSGFKSLFQVIDFPGLPRKRITVIILANLSSSSFNLMDIIEGILPDRYEIPTKHVKEQKYL